MSKQTELDKKIVKLREIISSSQATIKVLNKLSEKANRFTPFVLEDFNDYVTRELNPWLTQDCFFNNSSIAYFDKDIGLWVIESGDYIDGGLQSKINPEDIPTVAKSFDFYINNRFWVWDIRYAPLLPK